MERIGGLGPEMRPEGVDEAAPQTLRWAMAEAIGLVWRLRPWLATMAPGGLGPTVRPYYEGLPIDRLDEGRTNAAKAAGIRASECSLSGHGRTVPRPKIATVERREARRPASSAGDLGRSRDRSDREAGHGHGVSVPAPVGALPPSHDAGGTRGRRTRRRNQQGQRSIGFSSSPSPAGGGWASKASPGGLLRQAPIPRTEGPHPGASRRPSPCRGG